MREISSILGQVFETHNQSVNQPPQSLYVWCGQQTCENMQLSIELQNGYANSGPQGNGRNYNLQDEYIIFFCI